MLCAAPGQLQCFPRRLAQENQRIALHGQAVAEGRCS